MNRECRMANSESDILNSTFDIMRNQIEEHQRVVGATAERIELLGQIAERIIACFEAGGKLY